jgi:hypothetical protein
VWLAQNRPHSSYGRDSRLSLQRSLDLFYKYYNEEQRDDVRIFHEGDFGDADQRAVTRRRSEIAFVQLQQQDWQVYPPTLMQDARTWKSNSTFTKGYRKMIRWFAVRLWPRIAALGYRWVARFDDDAFLLSRIPCMQLSRPRTHRLHQWLIHLASPWLAVQIISLASWSIFALNMAIATSFARVASAVMNGGAS